MMLLCIPMLILLLLEHGTGKKSKPLYIYNRFIIIFSYWIKISPYEIFSATFFMKGNFCFKDEAVPSKKVIYI